jgi:dTDP-D-glucose 4,6-dehydratase
MDGTFTLLESVRGYWQALAQDERAEFRFVYV